jgi:hypothetical protein
MNKPSMFAGNKYAGILARPHQFPAFVGIPNEPKTKGVLNAVVCG